MKTARFMLPVICLLFSSYCFQAQEFDDPIESSELYQVQYFKFVPESILEAKKIIHQYFKAANEMVGVPNPVIEFDLTSSDFNYMVVWKVNDGKENLNWQNCPNNDEWYKALVNIAGGEEKAKEIIIKYDSFIKDAKTELAKKL